MERDDDDFQWGIEAKVEVGAEIGAVQEQRRRAQAAGDLDEDHRLKEEESRLWRKLNRIAHLDPKIVRKELGLPDVDLPPGFYNVDHTGEIRPVQLTTAGSSSDEAATVHEHQRQPARDRA